MTGTQLTIGEILEQAVAFDGETYEAEHDLERLSSQLEKVKAVLLRGGWYTLSELKAKAGGSEAGISARLRDCRKARFGGYQVERRRRGNPAAGVWEYSVRLK
jgi:hypothetical protein